jgi:hypothetical protein
LSVSDPVMVDNWQQCGECSCTCSRQRVRRHSHSLMSPQRRRDQAQTSTGSRCEVTLRALSVRASSCVRSAALGIPGRDVASAVGPSRRVHAVPLAERRTRTRSAPRGGDRQRARLGRPVVRCSAGAPHSRP